MAIVLGSFSVVPAQAGVILSDNAVKAKAGGSPRTSGGDPQLTHKLKILKK